MGKRYKRKAKGKSKKAKERIFSVSFAFLLFTFL